MQPSAIQDMSDAELEALKCHPLAMKHPCHNQDVKQHIKLVTEASMPSANHENRDDLIKQQIHSRKLLNCFESQYQFPSLTL